MKNRDSCPIVVKNRKTRNTIPTVFCIYLIMKSLTILCNPSKTSLMLVQSSDMEKVTIICDSETFVFPNQNKTNDKTTCEERLN